MSTVDLESVISDSISDAGLPSELSPETDTSLDTTADAPVEALETPTDDSEVTTEAEPSSLEVTSPANRQATPATPPDPFEKKIGIPSQTNGRENRIPYSRVKKIVENAEKAAATPYTTRIAELEPKLKDYEARLGQVAQFENVMVNDPQQFLSMLSRIPAYAQFFKTIEQLASGVGAGPGGAPPDPNSDMPQPDEELGDGTKVYSMNGLQKLLDWRDAKVSAKVEQQISSRYAPIEQEWRTNQQIQQLVPQVQAQIEEARKWPLFNESENEIVSFLQANPKSGLEDAYRSVVFPKLVADRNTMRQSLLAELKTAPPNTSSPTRQSKAAPAPTGPRSIEDVIKDSISILK